MFMIAILFFLGLWVLGTILFMVLGWKAKRHFGLFVGFMLPMGNFIVYWAVEYWMLQARVTRLCETRGGTKIYLTPEEYRKKIGEEEWKNLHEIDEIIHVGDGIDSLLFQGRKYKPRGYDSNRIISFQINGIGGFQTRVFHIIKQNSLSKGYISQNFIIPYSIILKKFN